MTLVIRAATELVIWAILSMVAIFFTGCITGMGYSSEDRITNAAREYNDGVRWGRLEKAADHITKDAQKRFYDRHRAVEDELDIADWEMVSLELDKSDKKVTRATARVQYTWTLKRVGLLEKTTTEQKWEELNREWIMVSETRTKGSPLTLFDEPTNK